MNSTLKNTETTTTPAPRSTRRKLVSAIAGLTLVAAACGGSDDAEPAAAEPAPAEESVEASVGFAESDLGSIIVDEAGRTLYGFTPDEDGLPTCVDGCADAWPPYAVAGDTVPAGLDESIFSVVAHPSGVNQLKAGKWPLYLFAGDITPGDTNGQGSGDVWFVAAADGSLIKGAAGAAAPAADTEPAADPTADAESDGYDY